MGDAKTGGTLGFILSYYELFLILRLLFIDNPLTMHSEMDILVLSTLGISVPWDLLSDCL